jgi:hypothetical protein
MKRRWNLLLWAGFAIILAAIPAYFVYFVRFQNTRELPWVNFLLFALAVAMLWVGIRRAYKWPQEFRGKVAGPALASLSLLLIGFFLVFVYSSARSLPASMNAPQMGQRVPDFTLPDSQGHPVTLSTLLGQPFASNDWPATSAGAIKTSGAVLIFYRGYW